LRLPLYMFVLVTFSSPLVLSILFTGEWFKSNISGITEFML
jgi:hypothetical protein